MKNFLLISNIVLLILVGVLFYLHFAGSTKPSGNAAVSKADIMSGPFKIAYFEMDSIQNKYEYLKDVTNELKGKESKLSADLEQMKKGYFGKVNKFQQEAQGLSAERQGAMQQELMQEQKVIQNKEQAINAELQDESFKKMQAVNKTIETYLENYNKTKGYAYILAHQPGFIYFKKPQFDITSEILTGLNQNYKKKE